MSHQSENPSFWSLFTQDPSVSAKTDNPSFWSLFANHETPEETESADAGAAPFPSSALSFDERKMFWGMRDLPVTEALKHLVIIGCTGSGKSTAIQLFLQSIAPRFKNGRKQPEQLILFDGKCEAVTQLASLGFYPEDENVHILNPYDERCSVWDIGAETNTPLMARNLASLLVPEEPQSSAPFFAQSACDLIYAVMLGLNRSKIQWTFRDLICALDSKNRMKAIAACDPRGKSIFNRIFGDQNHAFGVYSSLGTKIVKFEQVAALWHSTKNAKKFTIDKFLKNPGVLILGDDPKLHSSLWPMNALILKALSEEILRNPKTIREPRQWFVLDEFPVMKQVDCVHELLRRGRSKGISMLLGAQGLESLYNVHREYGTEDMISQCAYKTFLRDGGPTTAEWAERFFGKVRMTETTRTESWGQGGRSFSRQYHTTDRPLFLSSVFLNLPFPVPGGPFISISDVPCMGSTFITRRWFDDVLSWLEPMSTIPALLPRLNVDDQTLQPWSSQEEKLFTGKTESKSRKAKKGKSKKSAKSKKPDPKPYLPGPKRRKRRKLPPDF
jgi:type IV secretory pathway TraG/TraD family ATPase VirD4